MGSGWVEILFILLILLAPVFEAWKKQRKRGGAGAPDEREGEGGRREAGAGRPEHGDRASSGRDGPPATGEAPGTAQEERGAEELLPEDLWKILTGQAPPDPGRPSPPPGRVPEDPGRSPDGEGREDPGRELEPVSSEAAPPVEPGRAPGTDLDSYRSATLEPDDSPPGGADLGGLMSERPDRKGQTELRTEARPGEIGSGTYRASAEEGEEERELPTERMQARGPMQRTISGAVTVRGGSASTHPFFRDLDRSDLRRAMVLNEVLGPPLSLRNEGD